MSTLRAKLFRPVIGVLDIQGSVKEHAAMLEKIGATVRLVKSPRDLDGVAGLIMPGGESTTISKLLASTGLDEEIRKRAMPNPRPSAKTGGKNDIKPLAVWGTCAGAILLAKNAFGLMDIEMERNAYGSQQNSFETDIQIEGFGGQPVHAIFIRAPKIRSATKDVCILARHNNTPVMTQQKNFLATTFHPELTDDTRIHEYFIHMTRKKSQYET